MCHSWCWRQGPYHFWCGRLGQCYSMCWRLAHAIFGVGDLVLAIPGAGDLAHAIYGAGDWTYGTSGAGDWARSILRVEETGPMPFTGCRRLDLCRSGSTYDGEHETIRMKVTNQKVQQFKDQPTGSS